MRMLTDYQGRPICLTEERQEHILRHKEMIGLESAIEETLGYRN